MSIHEHDEIMKCKALKLKELDDTQQTCFDSVRFLQLDVVELRVALAPFRWFVSTGLRSRPRRTQWHVKQPRDVAGDVCNHSPNLSLINNKLILNFQLLGYRRMQWMKILLIFPYLYNFQNSSYKVSLPALAQVEQYHRPLGTFSRAGTQHSRW